MQRQTKFRGKRLDTGEWVYGGIATSREGKTWIMADSDLAYRTELVDLTTVGQYINLKDKNGVEAYEHDLVEITWNAGLYGNESLVTGIYEIKRREDFNAVGGYGDFYLDNGPSISYIKSGKIIGNTFDNPDMVIGNK